MEKLKIKGIKKAVGWSKELPHGYQYEILYDMKAQEIVGCSDILGQNDIVRWRFQEDYELPIRINPNETIKGLTERIEQAVLLEKEWNCR